MYIISPSAIHVHVAHAHDFTSLSRTRTVQSAEAHSFLATEKPMDDNDGEEVEGGKQQQIFPYSEYNPSTRVLYAI